MDTPMAMHLEFVVPRPPISNQQSTAAGKASLMTWHGVIAGAVAPLWGTKPILTGELKAVFMNFFAGNKPSVDVDNMSKPILDEMQVGVPDLLLRVGDQTLGSGKARANGIRRLRLKFASQRIPYREPTKATLKSFLQDG